MKKSASGSNWFSWGHRATWLSLALASVACSKGSPSPSPVPSVVATAAAAPSAEMPSTPVLAPASVRSAETPDDSSQGEDLIGPALRLFRVAACGDAGEVPERLQRVTVDRHCALLASVYGRYRQNWVAKAGPFFANLRPKDLPIRVVYPFGGGDLVSALTVYPDAEEITTLSLEPPGDVRAIDTILPVRLKGALAVNARNLTKLLGISYSNTINLGKGGRAALPGEIVLLLAALVVHGYEPVHARYFHIREDGSLHYLTAPEVVAEGERGHPAPEGAGAAFANVEIRFRKPGGAGPERVVRHIAQDLSNQEVGKTPGLRKYLESRGTISAMTKAASHLLWADDFSTVREYLLDHAVWMPSDSTGIPPRFASAAGFIQETFGTFDGPARFGPIEPLDGKAFRNLFTENPKRELPFKYGYGDVHHHSHLVITRKKG